VGNITFVVWRESLEAMLVMGVLLGWIRASAGMPLAQWQMRMGVYLGACVGLLLAGALALLAYQVQSQLADNVREWLQLAMVLLAWGLMLHMVFWMRRYGPQLSQKVRATVSLQRQRSPHASSWNVASTVGGISALAVAREGAETVVFVAGFVAQRTAWSAVGLALAVLSGIALAAVTVGVLAVGLRLISHRLAFRVSEMGMLVLAAGLLCAGIDQFIALDGWSVLLPGVGFDPFAAPALWDSSAWLSDAQGLGAVLADFAGYRAQPGSAMLALLTLYWLGVIWALRRRPSHSAVRRTD
jgi:high-affinity iron transporter